MNNGFIQRFDGEFTDVTDGVKVACCDCGLIHYYQFEVLDGRVLKRCFRLNRETAGFRNGMKHRKEGVFKKKRKS